MVKTIMQGVLYDEDAGVVTFRESAENTYPLLHQLEYAEEINPYQTWEDTVSQLFPMLDKRLIPSLVFQRES